MKPGIYATCLNNLILWYPAQPGGTQTYEYYSSVGEWTKVVVTTKLAVTIGKVADYYFVCRL